MTTSADLSPMAQALARVPTGIYLLTTRAGDEPLGLVASFVMQVGFEPPTVMTAVGSDRDHLAAIRASGRFAISVLDEQSSSLMGAFFSKQGSPFDTLDNEDSPGGMPVFKDALAWLDCRVSGEHDAGDHVAVFGVVETARLLREGDPSVHFRKNGLSY
jgi:3-hydroxy-9,10-secoandrosta-1,3,5(10)-triene-9,17-dione monooxygenase reductase component